jgi:hypothetical protein
VRIAPLFFLPQTPQEREIVVLYRLRAALGLKFADPAVVVETERPGGVAALHARKVPDRLFAGTCRRAERNARRVTRVALVDHAARRSAFLHARDQRAERGQQQPMPAVNVPRFREENWNIVKRAEVGVTLDPLQGIELDLKRVIAYLGSKDERGALPKVASRDAQPDDAAFPMASAQRFGDREVPFAAELHNNVLIIRSNALSAGKAELRQVFAVEVAFENRARDLSGSHDYLLAQGRSAPLNPGS